MFRNMLVLFARRADTILAQCHMSALMDLPADATIDAARVIDNAAVAPAEAPDAAVKFVEEFKRAA